MNILENLRTDTVGRLSVFDMIRGIAVLGLVAVLCGQNFPNKLVLSGRNTGRAHVQEA